MSNVFQTALGANFDDLPPAVQQLHQGGRFAGRVTVDHGRELLAMAGRFLGGFPPECSDAPFAITVVAGPITERWVRDFNGHQTTSSLWIDTATGQLHERLGFLNCTLQPVLNGDVLEVAVPSVRLAGLALPKAFVPRSTSREWQDNEGRFRFDIAAGFPDRSPLIRYRGWLISQV